MDNETLKKLCEAMVLIEKILRENDAAGYRLSFERSRHPSPTTYRRMKGLPFSGSVAENPMWEVVQLW